MDPFDHLEEWVEYRVVGRFPTTVCGQERRLVMARSRRALLAGETWMSYGIHLKGFNAYNTGGYAEGQTEFVEALVGQGWDVDHIPNHRATETFPTSTGELAAYDVVLLSDIGADTLLLHPDTFERGQRTPNRFRLLDEYVTGGGGLLMVGGYMSFSGFEGKARYQGTPLAGVLPVTMLGHDDRIEAPEGMAPRVVTDHEVLAGLPSEWPAFLGYNRIVAKPEATLLMTIGDDPFLVLGTHGAGRTSAFASDCSPHWGSPDFLAWKGYATFWDQLLGWLAEARGPAS